MRRALICAALTLPGFFSCATQRTVRIESSRPARVLDRGTTVCARTPCDFTYSRETCFFFDSSTGFVVLEGLDAQGNRTRVVWVTCRAKEGERKFLDFEKPETR